ncbi:MAG: FAD:protein FMN transferase [Candidatus Omnitrophota bacterium]
MKLSLRNEIRRCRPLLGTFVEITVENDGAEKAQKAIDHAFSALERIHKLMSFHAADSEVSKLNRLAFDQPVRVSLPTYNVLKQAKKIYQLTKGIFDIAIAPELMRWKFLPCHSFLKKRSRYSGSTRDIKLFPNRSVRFLRPLQIDLGGIAKGFAVDEAVRVLKENGIKSGLVNAGGDLRCFGEQSHSIWIRHPKNHDQFISFPAAQNLSLATSANSYQGRWKKTGCVHVDGQSRQPLFRSFSVSVYAGSCLIADALTKVVLAIGERSNPLLEKLNAAAFIVQADDKILCYNKETYEKLYSF